jgi:erythromycin esterase
MRVWALTVALVLAACLSACSGGGGDTAANEPDPTANAPVYTLLRAPRLLTDAELRTPAAPSTVSAPSASEMQWLQGHHHPLRSLVEDTSFADLDFLQSELAGRRVVQLGESSHGTAEFNLIKVRLIKFLHERMGFNVLAFESSVLSCHFQDKGMAAAVSSPAEMTRDCLFPVWQTAELSELFRYIKTTHATSRPLRLAGFDVQKSGRLDSTATLAPWIQGLTRRVAPGSDARVAALLAGLPAGWFDPQLDVATLMAPVKSLLEQGSAQSTGELKADYEMALLALRALHDRNNYYRESERNPNDQGAREKGMAQALTALAQRVYPSEKIIAWAHNGHVANHLQYFPGVRPMGDYLRESLGAELYTVGLFMLRGENVTNFNTRGVQRVKDPNPGSLEALAYGLNLGAVFLPIGAADQPGAGDDWQHRSINFRSWGNVDHQDVLSNNYNGLIVIDRSSPPAYH